VTERLYLRGMVGAVRAASVLAVPAGPAAGVPRSPTTVEPLPHPATQGGGSVREQDRRAVHPVGGEVGKSPVGAVERVGRRRHL
jgi:hypothetical protein